MREILFADHNKKALKGIRLRELIGAGSPWQYQFKTPCMYSVLEKPPSVATTKNAKKIS